MKLLAFLIVLFGSIALSQVVVSPNMGMPIPIPGQTIGPDWANDINASLNTIDEHNHTPGQGVPVPSGGININADLPFNGNSCTLLKTAAFSSQNAPLSNNLNSIYVSGKELYYNDSVGNQVQITHNGSVNAGAGSITGLPSGTASASYSVGTFIWQSATNTAATMDAGSYILRNLTASSHGLTLDPPNAMAADYSLVLPQVPSSARVLVIDTSGNITPSSVSGTGSTQADVLPNLGLIPTGAILPFGGTSAPAGYALCDGTSYTRTGTTAALFAVIGTAYGAADSSHFNVPDLRGKFPRGDNGSTSVDPGTRTACATGGNSSGVGSCEADAFQSHEHVIAVATGWSGAGSALIAASNNVNQGGTQPTSGIVSGPNVSTETRPINVSVNYIIKL